MVSVYQVIVAQSIADALRGDRWTSVNNYDTDCWPRFVRSVPPWLTRSWALDRVGVDVHTVSEEIKAREDSESIVGRGRVR